MEPKETNAELVDKHANTCNSRCPFFNKSIDQCRQICKKKDFYCVTGIRTILRKIRAHLKEKLSTYDVILDRANMRKTERDNHLTAFFDEVILKNRTGSVAQSHVDMTSEKLCILKFFLGIEELQEQAEVLGDYKYVHEQHAEEFFDGTSMPLDCKQKRSNKSMIKAIGMKNKRQRSSFDSQINKKHFQTLHNISLLPKFIEYVRVEVLADVMAKSDTVIELCRN